MIARRGVMGPGMLVIADRNFCGYPVAAVLAATGADFLIRAKSSQKFPVLEVLPDGSYLSVLPGPAAARAWWHRNGERRRRGSPLPPDPRSTLPGIPIRVIEAGITITPAGGLPRTERYRLITTLTDPQQAPAAAVAACYAERWEIETSYREVKTFTLGPGRVLRSCGPACITQEIWARSVSASSSKPAAPRPPRQATTPSTPTGSPTPSPCAPSAAPSPPG